MSLNDEVKTLLEKENIEFMSVLDIEECKIFQPHLLPENIKSVFLWLIPYYTGRHENRNVSLYSVSRDYHLFSRSVAENLKSALKAKYPDGEFYFFCDSSPISEVSAALKTGLGVIGNNNLIINEKYGSYVFIGSMLTTIRAKSTGIFDVKRCLGCGKCAKECDYLSGKCDFCVSELNQRKNVTDGELAIIKSKKIRWGCDVCQEVCPMNRAVPKTPIEFFHTHQIENVTPELLEGMTKEQFKQRAYAWRGKKVILRNVED